jgi:FAD:protein FMN transferase
MSEAIEEFACFGSRCAVLVSGPGTEGSAQDAAALAKRTLLGWHERFSRFLADSELARVNRDPHATVRVSPLMARLAQAVRDAGSLTGGLVDATLVGELERAGYDRDLGEPLALARALQLAGPRTPAGAAPARAWREIEVDADACTVTRPLGVKIDSGGLAKGLFADVLGETLGSHASFAVNCAGDLRVGGAAAGAREIKVESPFDGTTLHTFAIARTGVATSGIGRRSWLDDAGRPAHHLLDPATGRPAFTGIVQVTALAASALEAEMKAKAAILSGPARARMWLAQGGVIVFDDGSHELVTPPPVLNAAELSAFARDRSPNAAATSTPASASATAIQNASR